MTSSTAPKKSSSKKSNNSSATKVKQQTTVVEEEQSGLGPLNLTTVHKPFKNSNYKTPKKSKNLKQILAAERTQELALDVPTYQNIECPPSVLPQKKYCDVTGLAAKYTDPKTGLRYHNSEIYQFVRTLSVPNVQAYLASRNAAVVLK